MRPCLVYHAYTLAYRLYAETSPVVSETDVRVVLRRFRALENEWDRAPLNGSLRNGHKKFLSIPWVWHRICLDVGLPSLKDVLFTLPAKKKCISKREDLYSRLKSLV